MGLKSLKALQVMLWRSLSVFCLCVLFPIGVQAQTLIFQAESEKKFNPPVIDATANNLVEDDSFSPPTSVASTTPSAVPSSINVELLSMIEQLQEELQALRGTVEEQSQQIRILKKSAKSRYLDLDKRILDLSKKANSSSLVSSETSVVNSSGSAVVPAGGVASLPGDSTVDLDRSNVGNAETGDIKDSSGAVKALNKSASEEERRAYNNAYAEVKSRNFEVAIKKFYAFIDKYPDGDLAGNAYYWLGEVYLVIPQLEQAEQAFTIVVQAYQDHPKVADALYKLGVTLDRMQKPKQSEEYLMEVQKRYPNSTASKLAKSYKINR